MYNALVNEVADVRCRSKDKCEGCIFVSRDGDKDGKKTRIHQVDKNTGKIIKTYNSIREAAKENHSYADNISRALNGVSQTSLGYKWIKA